MNKLGINCVIARKPSNKDFSLGMSEIILKNSLTQTINKDMISDVFESILG